MGVIAVAAVLLFILAWFFWPSRTAPTRSASRGRGERHGVDEAELEAAERDVKEAADEHTVRDWGPGTGQKPLP